MDDNVARVETGTLLGHQPHLTGLVNRCAHGTGLGSDSHTTGTGSGSVRGAAATGVTGVQTGTRSDRRLGHDAGTKNGQNSGIRASSPINAAPRAGADGISVGTGPDLVLNAGGAADSQEDSLEKDLLEF